MKGVWSQARTRQERSSLIGSRQDSSSQDKSNHVRSSQDKVSQCEGGLESGQVKSKEVKFFGSSQDRAG